MSPNSVNFDFVLTLRGLSGARIVRIQYENYLPLPFVLLHFQGNETNYSKNLKIDWNVKNMWLLLSQLW